MNKPSYEYFLRETHRLYPEKTLEEREAIAKHATETHPGFISGLEQVSLPAVELQKLLPDSVPAHDNTEAILRQMELLEKQNGLLQLQIKTSKTTNKILFAIILLAALVLCIAGLSKAQDAPLTDKNSPITIIPLEEADKLKVRDIQFKQDKLIIQLKDLQKQEDETLKQINDMNTQINQLAGDFAQKQRINTQELVLDLDKLSWVTKAVEPKGDSK